MSKEVQNNNIKNIVTLNSDATSLDNHAFQVKVGTKVISEFKKVSHPTPMFSLGDVFNEDEIKAFCQRVDF